MADSPPKIAEIALLISSARQAKMWRWPSVSDVKKGREMQNLTRRNFCHYKKTSEYIFYDCSVESPKGRTSLCYDREGLESRKEHKPGNNAIDMAVEMGIELLTEEQYRELQTLGEFDTKTSSWLKTPDDIRKLGGAIFGDRRFGHVFVYHNGAQSYYGVRGFRGSLRV